MEKKVSYRIEHSKSKECWEFDSKEKAEESMKWGMNTGRLRFFKVTETTEDITPPPRDTLDDLIDSLWRGDMSVAIRFLSDGSKSISLTNNEVIEAAFHPSDYNYSTGFYKSQRDAKIALVTEILLNGE